MNVNLGPWTAYKSVDSAMRQSLLDAMSDEAWKTVKKTTGFTAAKGEGTKADRGVTISGILTKVTTSPGTVEVVARFEVYVDGGLSTQPISEGRATASGGRMGAEDALRAVTETRVKNILGAIKAGRVRRMGQAS